LCKQLAEGGGTPIKGDKAFELKQGGVKC